MIRRALRPRWIWSGLATSCGPFLRCWQNDTLPVPSIFPSDLVPPAAAQSGAPAMISTPFIDRYTDNHLGELATTLSLEGISELAPMVGLTVDDPGDGFGMIL